MNQSYNKLKIKLDRIFSKYIRLRDSDDNGYCRCITCPKMFPWKEGDAGHFVQRNRMATRWNERNVNAQCRACNRFQSGNQFEHGKAIDNKFGEGTADLLQSLGHARGAKVDTFWMLQKIEHYKYEVKEML